jgi:hypothetical protein
VLSTSCGVLILFFSNLNFFSLEKKSFFLTCREWWPPAKRVKEKGKDGHARVQDSRQFGMAARASGGLAALVVVILLPQVRCCTRPPSRACD